MIRSFFVLILTLGLTSGLSIAQDSSAPYLDYYSDVLNAFVIERADGTDSRTLGLRLMSPDTNN